MRSLILLLAQLVFAIGPASAQVAMLPIPGAGTIHVDLSSLAAERYENIVRQSTDYSCGAAAVATILRYAYGLDATEASTIRGLLAVSDSATVRARGFSLLDIKRYVTSIGFVGTGYRLPLASLYRIQVPSIALITVDGYSHFVVLKHVDPNYAYVADPLLGNRRIATPQFARAWNGIIFVIAARTYRFENPLVALQKPVSLRAMMSGTPAAGAALSDAQLLLVYIPAMNRI